MSQSAAASYFKEVCPGEWEIQVPEDAVARESHRWPIGFVTTGYVQGTCFQTVGILHAIMVFLIIQREVDSRIFS
ncbi:Protein kinase domain-containing protein [Psidium guajava]|nr:Protein kinase domain-containing protein [Psidium guajava]